MNKVNCHPLLRAAVLVAFLNSQSVQAENATTPLDQIAAVVNTDVIMLSEAQQRAYLLRANPAAAKLAAPALLKQAVDDLILEKLQVQQADAAGIQIDEITLNKTIATIAQRNQLSLPAFQQALQQEGIDYADFREQTRRKLMVDALRKREVQAEDQFQAWLQALRNDAYVEYRIPIERGGLTLQ